MPDIELRASPAIYQSDRQPDNVLVGSDAAASVLEASSIGDIQQIQQLLAQPSQQIIALTTVHRIYAQSEIGHVYAMPILNLKAMVQRALKARQSACMTRIVQWGSEHDIPASSLFDWKMILEASEDMTLLAAVLEVYPPALREPLSHAHNLLIQAVYRNDIDLVHFLLNAGLTPSECENTWSPSPMFEAAYGSSAKIVDLLLRFGGQFAGSGAMHAAASRGRVDVMRILLPHSRANIDDRFSNAFLQGAGEEMQWTPMHFAAAAKQRKALYWLSRHGCDDTIRDAVGRSPYDIMTG